MGLLDHYRQFDAMSVEEVNAQLRAQADERKRSELARSEPLDLSRSTLPQLPHPAIVAAITHAARSSLRSYPDEQSVQLRRQIAQRHGLRPSQVALGNGAAQLIGSAVAGLLEPGQELICPWPSYPLYPVLAGRIGAGARPVRRPLPQQEDRDPGPADIVKALIADLDERTRLVVIANPDDPTGELIGAQRLRLLAESLPEGVALLIDEALIEFLPEPEPASAIGLLERFPQLIVFRSFSKAWGLAGLRIGYALGAVGAEPLLRKLEPDLGLSELSQAGALEALRSCGAQLSSQARLIAAERDLLMRELRSRGFALSPSQANFLWCRHPAIDAERLSEALREAGVLVAPGSAFGDEQHVRISVHSRSGSLRLLAAIDALKL